MVVNNITEPDKSIEILGVKINDLKIGKITKFFRKMRMKEKESYHLDG